MMLSNVEKFNYLKSKLIGAAKSAVAGLALSSANYNIAVDILRKRFGNPQEIVDQHYHKLVNLSPATNKVSSLREFLDNIERHLRCLEMLNQNINQDVFVSIVKSKLPEDVLLQIELQNGVQKWTIGSLKERIETYVTARERATKISRLTEEKDQHDQMKLQMSKNKQVNKRTHLSTQRSLCPKRFPYKKDIATVVNEIPESAAENTESNEKEPSLLCTHECVLMQTASTEIINLESNEAVRVRLLFDSGSHRSYITESLAKTLHLNSCGEETIQIVTFGSERVKNVKTKNTQVGVKLKCSSELPITVNIVPFISGALHRKPIKSNTLEIVRERVAIDELADELPTRYESSPIDVLIGNDYYLDFIQNEKLSVQPGLYLLSSKLGWILSGRSDDVDEMEEHSMLIFNQGSSITYQSMFSVDTPVQKPDLEDFWNVESIGIIDKDTRNDDMIALDKFKETVQFEDNRYHVCWPWKEDDYELPTNKELAIGRLKSTVKRLKSNPQLLQKYDGVIKDQLNNGIIERVNTDESNSRTHYIPHHAVITPQKSTTKVRVVYDASAKTKKDNKSLNECLYRGPVMLNNMCGILMRFRLHRVALVSDIEKAFLQIGLQDDQRDVTRFFWLKDITNPSTDQHNIQTYRFKRVPFGVISSPFLLGATIETHLDSYHSGIGNKIKHDIYVDNLITGTENAEEGKYVYTTAKSIFKDGAMNLREWVSNSMEVTDIFAPEDKAKTENVNILGHVWNVHTDTLSLRPVSFERNQCTTKRNVLQKLASVFDPLGLVSPVVLTAKLFMQNMWRKQMLWDDSLALNDLDNWNNIENNLSNSQNIHVPRYAGFQSTSSVVHKLLCFCDASEKAYAIVIYLYQNNQSKVVTQLTFAKTRLAPIKQMSIPKLELMAVLIGIRCLKFVKEQLHISVYETYLWTDSKCVLYWLKSTKELPVFVKNRVKEIRESTDVRFRYVPTAENPADIATRGITVENLQAETLWWFGPRWLIEEHWPVYDPDLDFGIEHSEHDSVENIMMTHDIHKDNANSLPSTFEGPLKIDLLRFSSITRLLRVTALALRFIDRLKGKQVNGHLATSEIHNAEYLWIAHIQHNYYKDVFEAIAANTHNNFRSQLGVFIDEKGLLRCKGRLMNVNLCENARLPILLPKGDRFTELVIDKIHKENVHSGVSQTLAAVRNRFWIPHGRAAVKQVLQSCRVCRRFECGPYKLPPMSAYPTKRVTESKPFSKIGLDYLGPLLVKDNACDKKSVGVLIHVPSYSCNTSRISM
ncbi:uncharacterized protein LOC128204895 [Mya arenaria]|uniref:uncharacterized protein LOC128204895 n=1 Tax=Mya arenaria TaxID=6604 RepID=UPI0022E19AC8|nr:uncharacterized protein LOC128204895 [Mya arenaria]